MDALDIKILRLLQTNGRMSVTNLSGELALSRPSAAERLHRLEERGVIEGYSASVSPESVGRDTRLVIQITDLKVAPQEFEQWACGEADITECHRVTGHASYFLQAAVAGTPGLRRLVDRLMDFGSVHTSVVLASPVLHRPMLPPGEEDR
ncbi:Lrp/AsnC family transcriptional regulator [Saccharibacillus sp. CPCC 101409]|uniref:Lrp/AsnC family transcriptional regulator n=1 Tax=Saccharibacillus sp. CPCC 101409 TaxID=3058041 RepID=UPI0026725635|nr:Lrp/AsnC family transcriptional regulator [Saccharibacillus sp. CPCC 101409]MDO3411597.1 Lrp/AsnC family transcriptional regulator [Saccharibacillus sp. CPCC 101409]